ncbi:1920_t:CDS:2 [Diversispora eburnea]|uniref:1920_t:CDS:1 n=1 Tax=Diversispora eburnea TaxID=1213867 RepID=A0A9N8ZUD5_9GLOM|nr:1920_t:CDS:2 [Diversispora eburnea]
MDPNARNAVNLNVLRRHDDKIVEIVDSSSYVVVYKFDNEQSTWTKKGVEGTLFVFKRCAQPAYGFIVMNRLGIDNFMAPLTDSMELEFQDEYIIYRTDDDNIHGIWVYEIKDRERIERTLRECRELSKTINIPPQLDQSPKLSVESNKISTSYGKPIDIVDLLQQAEVKQTNGSANSLSHYSQHSDLSQKDILGELFQKANIIDNPKQTLTPTLSLDSYMRNSSHPFTRNNQNNSDISLPNLLNTPDNKSSTSMASMALFGSNSPGLQRTHALDASIASLSRFSDEYDRQINRGKKLLSKTEFAQRYLYLIQNDPSFMDILYQNYIVKTHENIYSGS